MKPKILVSGLNPSWQKTLLFQEFVPYEVNRAKSSELIASGKGINFARAAMEWDLAKPCVIQFLGGLNGKNIRSDLDRESIAHISIDTGKETRICTTIISEKDSTMTELIEPASPVPQESADAFMEAFEKEIARVDALAICGTYPIGIDDTFYSKMSATAKKHGKFIFVDSFMGIEKTLRQGIDFLKINKDELTSLSKTGDVIEGMKKIGEEFRIPYIAITDGSRNAFFSDGTQVWQISIPKIDRVLNPIGSGDTCSAVTLSEILSGTDPVEAFRKGLAAASANCLTRLPAFFSKSAALDLLKSAEMQCI